MAVYNTASVSSPSARLLWSATPPCHWPDRVRGFGLQAIFICLTKQRPAGTYTIFSRFRAMDGVVLRTDIRYPKTPERDSISSHASNLGRFTDNQWKQAVTLEFLLPSDGVRIHKRNFAGDVSAYPVADFKKRIPAKPHYDLVQPPAHGRVSGGSWPRTGGLARSPHARQVLGSLAHCPMRLEEERGTVLLKINPFGAYYGKQRYYPLAVLALHADALRDDRAAGAQPGARLQRRTRDEHAGRFPAARRKPCLKRFVRRCAPSRRRRRRDGQRRGASGLSAGKTLRSPRSKAIRKRRDKSSPPLPPGVRISLLALLNMGVRFAFTFVSSSMKNTVGF